MADIVAIADAQAVLDALRDEGWTHDGIARHSGVSRRTVQTISTGQVLWVRGATFRALTALCCDEPTVALVELFDPAPLIAAVRRVGLRAVSDSQSTTWFDRQIERWSEAGGIPWCQADRWANRLGLHPSDPMLWGDLWWAPSEAA